MLNNFRNFFICKKKQIIIIGSLLVLGMTIVLFNYLFYLTNNTSEKLNNEELISLEKEDITPNVLEETVETKTIFVDIKGEVNSPGVYELDENSRVINAIDIAGGLTNNAFTRNINLSKKLVDEVVIIVNSITEIEELKNVTVEPCECEEINYACTDEPEQEELEEVNKKININTATVEELITLSGIGESKAKNIIEYRETNGFFKTIEDLLLVSGIGESIYASIKENITV